MDQVVLAADDAGFLSGVVIVDRLRTVSGGGLDVAEHIRRFELSCQAVGIELPSQSQWQRRVEQVIAEDRDRFAPRDFSVLMLATPGRLSAVPPQPTLLVAAEAIDWRRLARWYAVGQELGLAPYRNVPAACWSPAIKSRARMHYYLADRHVQLASGDRYAAAVLLDSQGHLTETSSANVLLVEGRELVSPRREAILAGISLQRTWRLAQECGYRLREADISPQRAEQAEAILLCGSTGLLWSAAKWGQRIFSRPVEHPVYRELLQAWCDDVRFDFVRAAAEWADSAGA